MTLMQMMADKEQGSVLLHKGCYCSRRRQGAVTVISEILSTEKGAAGRMLEFLFSEGAEFIVAKCPAMYESNVWYVRRGFKLVETGFTTSSRILLNTWRLSKSDFKLSKR